MAHRIVWQDEKGSPQVYCPEIDLPDVPDLMAGCKADHPSALMVWVEDETGKKIMLTSYDPSLFMIANFIDVQEERKAVEFAARIMKVRRLAAMPGMDTVAVRLNSEPTYEEVKIAQLWAKAFKLARDPNRPKMPIEQLARMLDK